MQEVNFIAISNISPLKDCLEKEGDVNLVNEMD